MNSLTQEAGNLFDYPLSERHIEEAVKTVQDRFDLDPASTEAAAILDAKRKLWKRQSADQELGVALRRVAVGLGEILILRPGEAPDHSPEMAALPLPITDQATISTNGQSGQLDTLSHSKIAAAEEVVAAATIDAIMREGSDPLVFRKMLWFWSKNSPELDLAFRRLAVISRQPLTIALIPSDGRVQGRVLPLLSGKLN